MCRGSRQGDPISSYFFNIALDTLNSLIIQSLPTSIIHVNEFPIPSLMYCDDTVICVNSAVALKKALSIIDEFAKMSNLTKTFGWEMKGWILRVKEFAILLNTNSSPKTI
eukprot:TRINITY_DN3875_c0_g1_i1.p1 TRINITY_DN3875_c0_g1~~TRINITY_DN3875_c0_g1_i1.p1  ORF type:complete len:110 (-),score=13.63 TRINITY_DN3875_c0_g1_i1:136-465(-)